MNTIAQSEGIRSLNPGIAITFATAVASERSDADFCLLPGVVLGVKFGAAGDESEALVLVP